MEACPTCGSENPRGARFCSSCGTSLAESPAPRKERKVVTVLFADIVGSTSRAEQLDPEDVGELLGRYHARSRAELERFGGTVEKFIGDAVVALFGAPTAHEDDPERAVRAALAIREAILEDDELDLQVRIAVNTGEALITLGGAAREGEGMAAGDVVNSAARMQAGAPVNGILVGEQTYRATAHAIEYRHAEPVQAKGKSEPVPVWEAVGARARLGDDVLTAASAPLVGRARELDVLLDALARVRAERETQLVTLVGVPGIGKSRLVYEVLQAVHEDAELIFWRQGRCLPYGDGVTFWALGEMVKAHAGILETDSSVAVEQKLKAVTGDLLGEESAWVQRHLRPLVGLAPDGDRRDDAGAEAFAAWRRFFEALAEQRPLVLAFEDLHWADAALLDFVDHLVEWARGVPILVLCTARPELLERRPGWGGGKLNSSTLGLAPLTDEDTAALLSALLERAFLPAAEQPRLLARAGGNPLYAEQYVRMLADRGQAADVDLPESVQGIIAARLDALPSGEKALLQDAAVVGKVFWGAALGHDTLLEERLHALELKDFVRRERRSSVGGETQYAFRHVLVRDVAYGQIPRAERASKHRRVAEWIDSLSERTEDHAEMLAHHYSSALELAQAAGRDPGDLGERARRALREAGERASALSATAAEARYYGAALELWPPEDADHPRLRLLHQSALVGLGEGDVGVLADARDALLAADDRQGAADAEMAIGWIAWRQGLSEQVREHMDRAVELVGDLPPSPGKANLLNSRSIALLVNGRYDRAVELARGALEIAGELGLEDDRANALNTIGTCRVFQGELEGIEQLRESIAIALERASPVSIRGYKNLATVLVDLGDLREAFRLQAEGLMAAARFGDLHNVRWFEGELILEHYMSGRWDEALALADAFIARVEGGLAHYMETSVRQARALMRLARGDAAGALADAERHVEFAREGKDPQAHRPAVCSYARACAALGRTEEGAAPLVEMLDEWAGDLNSSGLWLPVAAAAATEVGVESRLLEALGRARGESPWIEAATAFAEGRFLRAAETYGRIGSLPDEALARLRAAERSIADGRAADAERELERSLAFWRSVGATAKISEGRTMFAARA